MAEDKTVDSEDKVTYEYTEGQEIYLLRLLAKHKKDQFSYKEFRRRMYVGRGSRKINKDTHPEDAVFAKCRALVIKVNSMVDDEHSLSLPKKPRTKSDNQKRKERREANIEKLFGEFITKQESEES